MRNNTPEVNNLLIEYTSIKDHGPNFSYLTYGDSADIKVAQLLKLTVGSYVFFQTSMKDEDGKMKRYITAYYYIFKILVVGKDDGEISKFKYLDNNTDRVIIIGDENKSKILASPLKFDKELTLELHCLHFTPEYFQKKKSNLLTISKETHSHRYLDTKSVDLLRGKCEAILKNV